MFLESINVHVHTVPDLLWALLKPNSFPRSDKSESQKRSQATIGTPGSVVVDDKSPPPPLFALIIGINKYASATDLQGAVADADKIQDYLRQILGVPESRIKNLRNEEATRAMIISELRALQQDSRIETGGPILIYYAGHGGSAAAPQDWEAGGLNAKIQFIIPHDYNTKIDGNTVYGIPDRTIGILLEHLAKAKGDNITVVSDCCYSGSGTRIESEEVDPIRLGIRGINITAPIPSNLDKDIWYNSSSGRATAIAAGFLRSGLRSHMLLAACGSKETAKEVEGRGVFTKALLETLIAVGVEKITYTDLLQRIPSLPAILNVKVFIKPEFCLTPRHRAADVFCTKCVGVVTSTPLDAGAAHGVTEGAEFTVYKNRDFSLAPSPLGILIAHETTAFSTTLHVPDGASQFALAEDAFALQTRTGIEEDLRIHIAMDGKLIDVFKRLAEEMRRSDEGQRRIMLVEQGRAEVDIELKDGKVIFHILAGLATQFGLKRIPFSVNPTVSEVYPVIRAAAHYYWHLRRTSKQKFLKDKVEVEFTKVTQSLDKCDDYLEPIIHPQAHNLNVDNVVNVFVDDEAMYGMKIINKTEVALDLSIASYYQPGTSGSKVDAPLPPKGSLTVGYGAGGTVPYMLEGVT